MFITDLTELYSLRTLSSFRSPLRAPGSLLHYSDILNQKTNLVYNIDRILYRHRYLAGIYTTRKIHTKLHQGSERHIFHILTSEDIDDDIKLIDVCL